MRTLFRIQNPTSFWDGFSWILAPISAPFFDMFQVFGILFSSIDFAWIFLRFVIAFGPPRTSKSVVFP